MKKRRILETGAAAWGGKEGPLKKKRGRTCVRKENSSRGNFVTGLKRGPRNWKTPTKKGLQKPTGKKRFRNRSCQGMGERA